MPTVFLNDTSIEDLGLTATDAPPLVGGFAEARTYQPWTGKAGGLMTPYATTGERVLRFVADARVTTEAARLAKMDELAHHLTGVIEVRYADAPTRVLRGFCRVFEATLAKPTWVNIEPSVVVEIVCPLAHRWEAHPYHRVLTSTPVEVPVGTLPHGGRYWITGAAAGALATETRLRFRGVSGAIVGELVLLPALSAGEVLLVDADARSLQKLDTSGVWTDVYGWKTGGAFFEVAPRDSSPMLGAFGTLETTAGVALYQGRVRHKT